MSNKSLAKAPSDTCVLVTGGAGFIGSHTVVSLIDSGYDVVVLDDLSNSKREVMNRISEICDVECGDFPISGTGSGMGMPASRRLTFAYGSILDRKLLQVLFSSFGIDAIIHFAGFKAVGESVEKPWEYYWDNVAGTLVLADVARTNGVKNFIFSSSATVYGEPDEIPLTENSPKKTPSNPYGQTKSMIEQILTDLYIGDSEWNIALLRYFNPIGAHESGLIGEDPKGIPNNLVPYIAQVAVGKLEYIRVFGDDYPTPDGTGVRDYIHVVDLAEGHIAALEWMAGRRGRTSIAIEEAGGLDIASINGPQTADGTRRGIGTFNLGTGQGTSVLEVIAAFEHACGKSLPYRVAPRRPGDLAEYYAACDKAASELGWHARYDIFRMCEDVWRWQSKNPNGYV